MITYDELDAASYSYDALGRRTSVYLSTQNSTFCRSQIPHFAGVKFHSVPVGNSTDCRWWGFLSLYGEGSTPVGGLYTPAGSATSVAFEIVSDLHGDVRELRDTAGSAFARFSYDAYGNIRSEQTFATGLITLVQAQAISEIQPLRYAGYVFDSETRLYYCSERYYDPSVGAFISKDPAKAGGEKSAYGYCGGEPIDRTDPSGRCYRGADGSWRHDSWEYLTGKPLPPDPNPNKASKNEKQKAYRDALSSKPTFNGENGHVQRYLTTGYYKCSCCQKIYTWDGHEVKASSLYPSYMLAGDRLPNRGEQFVAGAFEWSLGQAFSSIPAFPLITAPMSDDGWDRLMIGVGRKDVDYVTTIHQIYNAESLKEGGSVYIKSVTKGYLLSALFGGLKGLVKVLRK